MGEVLAGGINSGIVCMQVVLKAWVRSPETIKGAASKGAGKPERYGAPEPSEEVFPIVCMSASCSRKKSFKNLF